MISNHTTIILLAPKVVKSKIKQSYSSSSVIMAILEKAGIAHAYIQDFNWRQKRTANIVSKGGQIQAET